MKTITMLLTLERSTKNKHVYMPISRDDSALGSVYVEKSALPSPAPVEIEITLKVLS